MSMGAYLCLGTHAAYDTIMVALARSTQLIIPVHQLNSIHTFLLYKNGEHSNYQCMADCAFIVQVLLNLSSTSCLPLVLKAYFR